ncbi:MAG: hypothetical protein KME46_20675 [Brasilonema angustatum HA4187-MV1]|jgi:hypothetical protein|nr:hypothetical protein [Brasilonema angustatum HA4187-MV1]
MKPMLNSINGTIRTYLLNSEKEVDGLLLKDGKQLHYPPHISAEFQQAVHPVVGILRFL